MSRSEAAGFFFSNLAPVFKHAFGTIVYAINPDKGRLILATARSDMDRLLYREEKRAEVESAFGSR